MRVHNLGQTLDALLYPIGSNCLAGLRLRGLGLKEAPVT